MSRQWIVQFEKGKARAELVVLLRVLEALGIELTASPTGDRVVTPAPTQARPHTPEPIVVDLDALLDHHLHSERPDD